MYQIMCNNIFATYVNTCCSRGNNVRCEYSPSPVRVRLDSASPCHDLGHGGWLPGDQPEELRVQRPLSNCKKAQIENTSRKRGRPDVTIKLSVLSFDVSRLLFKEKRSLSLCDDRYIKRTLIATRFSSIYGSSTLSEEWEGSMAPNFVLWVGT